MEQMNLEDWSPVEEQIKPVVEYERDCPSCGGSGPCFACERGRELVAQFKARQQAKKKPNKKRAA